MKYWKSGRYGLAFSSALAIGAIPAFGQDTAAADDEVVELSPFVVDTSKDVGYVATNSISGTRLNMSIKDVPLNLEVITSKFMQDTGATNLRDALRYSAGMVLTSQNDAFDNSKTGDFTTSYSSASGGANNAEGATRTAGDSTTKLRGFQNDVTLQDGFHRVFSADTVNIERVEVLRGPSSLLYGTGCFGGVVNFVTKKPFADRSMYHIAGGIGSDNYYRGELDVNLPLGTDGSWLKEHKAAVRVNTAFQTNADSTDFYDNKQWVVNAAFSIKPFESTTVTLQAEVGHKEETGVGFQNLRANVDSATDAASNSAAWATDIREWVATGGQDTNGDALGYVKSTPNPAIDNRTFRWSGDDTYLKGPYHNFVIDLEQKLGEDAYFKIGYSRSSAEFNSRQVNAWLTQPSIPTTYTSAWTGVTYNNRGGVAGSDGVYKDGLYSTYVTGGTFNADTAPDITTVQDAAIAYYWEDLNRTVDRDQIRAELMYKLDLDNWGMHTFIAGASYERIHTEFSQYRPAPTSWVESYYDADGNVVYGAGHSLNPVDVYSYKSIKDLSYFTYGTQGDGIADNPKVHLQDVLESDYDMGYYAVYQGQFFRDKLTFVGGVRWDKCSSSKTYIHTYANSQAAEGKAAHGQVDTIQGTQGDEPTEYSPQVGLSYSINDNFSVFGVYSTGVMPNFYAYDGDGKMIEPTKAENIEFGIKYDLFDGKLSGTLSYYHIKRENVPFYLWWAPNPHNDITSGFDTAQNSKFAAYYFTPDAFYYMIHDSGLDYDVAIEKMENIWPECWHPLIEEVGAFVKNGGVKAEGVSYGTLSSNFWDEGDSDGDGIKFSSNLSDILAGKAVPRLWGTDSCAYNTDNHVSGASVYFPLVEVTDSTTAQLLSGLLAANGWYGNVYGAAHNGETYLQYDKATGGTKNTTVNYGGSNGAYVPMDDEANGWDLQTTYTPFPELQMMFGFSHLTRKVTSDTYKFVKANMSIGAFWLISDNAYGTLSQDRKAADAYTDLNDASTYKVVIPMHGKSIDDSPENAATFWARYELKHMLGSTPFLKDMAIGLGAQWEDNRCWFSGYGATTGNTITMLDADGNRVVIEKWTEERITLNAMVEYKTKIYDKYDLRVALNVDNLTDDTQDYGYIYASGMSWRMSASIDF
jgi:outer membrane receptor protein involved in Fe transport